MKPETITPTPSAVLDKTIKHERLHGIRYARSGIGNRDLYQILRRFLYPNDDFSIFSPEFDAVLEEIVEDHPEHIIGPNDP